MRAADIVDNGAFWKEMFLSTDFSKYIEGKYKMAMGAIMEADDDDLETNL
jgi:hypothetical protein